MKRQTRFNILIVLLGLVSALGSIAGERTPDTFKNRRSYDGAPPVVPHEVSDSITKQNCLTCHQFGGYSPTVKANVPKTPHSELSQCQQCHVPQIVEGTYKNLMSEFSHFANEPTISAKSLKSAPPVIPHGPQYRQNCQACHTGAAAVSGLKSDHPHRQNCLQCHVWQNQKEMLIIK